MPALDEITIKGFKSIEVIESLVLRPINVIVGPNGSGKSNFIEAFNFLHAIREGRLVEYVARAGGANNLLHFGSGVTPRIEFHLSFQSQVNQYKVVLEATENDQLRPSMEVVYFWNKSKYDRPMNNVLSSRGSEAGISDPEVSDSVARFVRARLGGWRLYHFHDTSSSSPMKKTADVNDNRYLRPDGSNLSAFLYYLQSRHKPSYRLIQATVRQAAPFFDDFVLEPTRLNQDKIRLEWKHRGSDAYFDAAALSDGTLRFVALAALFLQPDEYRPSVIVVDEPELGLHPSAIALLASLVRQASVQSQVILSTQSSLLLDYLSPEDVLVANRDKSTTRLTRLDAEELRDWLTDYSLGQLWEKNTFGGRPGSV